MWFWYLDGGQIYVLKVCVGWFVLFGVSGLNLLYYRRVDKSESCFGCCSWFGTQELVRYCAVRSVRWGSCTGCLRLSFEDGSKSHNQLIDIVNQLFVWLSRLDLIIDYF